MAQNEGDVFVTQVMRGRRFEGHRVPVDALADLAAYQELITDLARILFLRQNQGRKRVPAGFEAGFQLSIESIGEGSAVLDLVRTRVDFRDVAATSFPTLSIKRGIWSTRALNRWDAAGISLPNSLESSRTGSTASASIFATTSPSRSAGAAP